MKNVPKWESHRAWCELPVGLEPVEDIIGDVGQTLE